MGDSILNLIAAVVAIAASVSAIVLGIDQLTSGAKLRNLEGILRQVETFTDGDARDGVLRDLHRATLGRLIAREAVPLRKFVTPVGVIAGAIVGGVLFGVLWGLQAVDMGWQDVVTVMLVTFIGWPLTQMTVRLIAERLRVARCYRSGITPIRAYTSIVARMEAGRHGERWWDLEVSLSCGITAWSVGRIAGGIYVDKDTGLSGTLAIAGFYIGIVGLIGGVTKLSRLIQSASTGEPTNRDTSLQPTWVSPQDS